MLHGYKIFSCIPHHLRNEVLREVRKLVSQYREGTPELAMFTVLADRLKEEKAIKDKIDALLAQGMLFGIIDQKTVRRHFEQ